ncbi:hypothetical protein CEXT_527051 [Caerostris extrusa]|uniref:Uncharacterized protein n=1 Tax=Caerostris extrusa TaxID=172846 RepID=A0AAV4T5X3_CAEEX|nr:hypothetical protein CEXT_527051 [Caerostris extrusa]
MEEEEASIWGVGNGDEVVSSLEEYDLVCMCRFMVEQLDVEGGQGRMREDGRWEAQDEELKWKKKKRLPSE